MNSAVWGVSVLLVAGFALTSASAAAQDRRQVARIQAVPALSQRVTLAEAGTSLAELLERLGEATQVQLVAEGAAMRAQKVVLYVQDEPVGRTLDELATMLGGQWVVQRAGGYALTRGPVAREESRRYFRDKAEKEQTLRRALFKRFQTLRRLALENAKRVMAGDPDPDARRFIDVDHVDLVPLLESLSQTQIERLFEAGAAARMGRVRSGPHSLWGFSRYAKKPAFSLSISELSAEDRARVHRWIMLRVDDTPLGERYQALLAGPRLTLHFGNLEGVSVWLCITGATSPSWGPDIPIASAQATPPGPADPLSSGLTAHELAAYAAYYHRTWGDEPALFPNLPGTVSGLRPEQKQAPPLLDEAGLTALLDETGRLSLPNALLYLHRSTGKNVISDYFTKPQRYAPAGDLADVGALLDGLAEAFGRNVTITDRSVRLRSVSWPDDEQAEVPWEVLRPWLEAAQEQGYLPSQHWLAMAGLSEVQRLGLCAESDLFGDVLAPAARSAVGAYFALEMYGSLSRQQQRHAERFELRWNMLTPEQWALVRDIAAQARGPRLSPAEVAASFRYFVRSTDKSPEELAREPLPFACVIGFYLGQESLQGHYLLEPRSGDAI